jgi:hypothetical protein
MVKGSGMAWVKGSVLVAALTHASLVPAQAADEDATRATARETGYAGVAAFQAGEYEVAVDKLGRAFGAVRVPTLGLWYARALVKVGRWVEASERYGEVVRLTVVEGQIEAQRQAQQDAAQELSALAPRIPRLSFAIEGTTGAPTVTVDGAAVKATLLTSPRPTDPGTHRVVGQVGTRRVEQDVTLAEGEQRKIVLRFSASGNAAPRSSAAAATSPPLGETTGSSWQRTAGWAGVGVGAAGIVVGTVTGLIVLGKKSSLDSEGCSNGVCSGVGQEDDVRSYNRFRTFSTVGYIAGAVAGAAGVTLLLTAPTKREAVSAFVGAGSVGIDGRF